MYTYICMYRYRYIVCLRTRRPSLRGAPVAPVAPLLSLSDICILLCMCPHTTIYGSLLLSREACVSLLDMRYTYVSLDQRHTYAYLETETRISRIEGLLTTVYMSSSSYYCVCVLILLYVSSYAEGLLWEARLCLISLEPSCFCLISVEPSCLCHFSLERLPSNRVYLRRRAAARLLSNFSRRCRGCRGHEP